jgi:hypothetical protein
MGQLEKQHSNMYQESWKMFKSFGSRISLLAGHQWLVPVILATQEAEIRRSKSEASLGK